MANKDYKQSAIGFSKKSDEQREKDEIRLREQGIFYVTGYGMWINWEDLEPDTLTFTQKYWDEANGVFTLLSAGKLIEGTTALRKGPWTALDIGALLQELDEWALNLSSGRQKMGELDGNVLRTLSTYAVEAYHDALMTKHAASFEATEELQRLIETEMGAEMVDTGAYYDKEGNQEGARDLVFELKNGSEVALQVYHNPRKVAHEGAIPERMQNLIAQWEVG